MDRFSTATHAATPAVLAAVSLVFAMTASAEPSSDSTRDTKVRETGESETVAAEDAGSGLQTVALPDSSTDLRDDSAMPPGPFGSHDHETSAVPRPVVRSDVVEADPFELTAVTWQGPGDVSAWVRVRSDGSWSTWYEVPPDHGHGTAESVGDDVGGGDVDGGGSGEGVRNGTAPLIVPRSDAVQVRVDSHGGDVPEDLRLDLVAPGEAPAGTAEADVAETGVPETDVAKTGVPETNAGTDADAAAAPRPTILGRAKWGADESMREDPPDYDSVRGAFIHHTVSASKYARGEVPGMIRSIYRYHVQSRGWNDIGYNFFVDRFGRIWEGRYGGVRKPVIGAHTQGYNHESFAMAALGTYTETQPTGHIIRAYHRLFAWKFAVHGVHPRSRVRYDQGVLPAIAAHRDAGATECPGAALYERRHQIRKGTITAMGLPLPGS